MWLHNPKRPLWPLVTLVEVKVTYWSCATYMHLLPQPILYLHSRIYLKVLFLSNFVRMGVWFVFEAWQTKKREKYLKISHVWAMIQWIGRHDDAPAFFSRIRSVPWNPRGVAHGCLGCLGRWCSDVTGFFFASRTHVIFRTCPNKTSSTMFLALWLGSFLLPTDMARCTSPISDRAYI